MLNKRAVRPFFNDIMKTIAITFAGRKDLMRNQVIYMKHLLDLQIIDEWHVWNFARNTADNEWLLLEFQNCQSNILLVQSPYKSYKGFRQVYEFYSNKQFNNVAFIKLDDDIVYCDTNKVRDFVQHILESENTITSANVVNNGVCAFYQSQAGWYSDTNLDFEYPTDGLAGTLWESSDICNQLHLYFLDNIDTILNTSTTLTTSLPQFDRFSINFVGFKQPIMSLMASAYNDSDDVDDERIMTQLLPKKYGIKKEIFNPLVVSHLSFWKQAKTLDTLGLLDRYYSLYN